jgi:hypothetical protein
MDLRNRPRRDRLRRYRRSGVMFWYWFHEMMWLGRGSYHNGTTLRFWMASDLEPNQIKRYINGGERDDPVDRGGIH